MYKLLEVTYHVFFLPPDGKDNVGRPSDYGALGKYKPRQEATKKLFQDWFNAPVDYPEDLEDTGPTPTEAWRARGGGGKGLGELDML